MKKAAEKAENILIMIGAVIFLGALSIGFIIMDIEFMTITYSDSVFISIPYIGIIVFLEGLTLKVLMYY